MDDYIAEASAERAWLLTRIRDLACTLLTDHQETMQWGMPVYTRSGAPSFGFAEQKNYVSLYFINPAALRKNPEALLALNTGKNCVRLRKSTKVDWALLERLLIDTRDNPRLSVRPADQG
ncbi:MAG TPA: DUF1801 domain-containing protein [Caulobacteraceae bacterium]|nr:DUF1801 domain-containing protein [Caulobacteraceae bacterium]